MPRIPSFLGFVIILASVLLISGIYGYHHKVNQAPQSVHHWRQSDCASITYNYYKYQYPPSQPHTSGLVSDTGKSALNLPSEIPFYYWGIAQLYKVFGPDEAILRATNTILFLSGLVALIYSLWLISANFLWSLLGGLMLFTSPVLVYYGNNFLSNSPALGMALIALALFLQFFNTGKKHYWWFSVLFFLFAGSLKLPGLFLFFAIVGASLIFRRETKLLQLTDILISLAVVLIPVFSWAIYARITNEAHHTVYFSTTIFPLWELTVDEIRYILSEIKKLWLKDYGHWSFLLFFLLLLLGTLRSGSNKDVKWTKIISLLVLGMVLFAMLQFYTFMQHDYYLINMYILAAVALAAFSWRYKNTQLLRSPILLAGMAILLAFNVHYASARHEFRYTGFHNSFHHTNPLLYDSFDQWLTDQNIASTDSLIFIGDDSHTSLYLMRRFGWTTHKMAFKDTSRSIYFNRDSVGVSRCMELGADYLVLPNWRDLYGSRSYLVPFAKHLQARHGELMVFDLQDEERNFTLPDKVLRNEIRLEPDSMISQSERTPPIVNHEAITGNAAFKIGSEDVYSLSTDIDDLSAGMTIEFSVWIKTNPERKLIPVISSLEPGLMFTEVAESIQEKGSWRRLKTEYLVTTQVAKSGVRCFIWNPEASEASIDDLRIKVYHPLTY